MHNYINHVRAVTVFLVWTIIALVIIVASSTYYIISVLGKPEVPAFVIHDFKTTTPIIEAGKPVEFELYGSRRYACASIIAAFWMNEAGSPVVRFPPITGGYTPIKDNYTIRFSVLAPLKNTLTGEDLPPGRYHYRSTNAPFCSGLVATETPDVSVCVTVPGKPEPPCVKEINKDHSPVLGS